MKMWCNIGKNRQVSDLGQNEMNVQKVTMGRNLCFVKSTHMGFGKSGMIHRQEDHKGGKWSI